MKKYVKYISLLFTFAIILLQVQTIGIFLASESRTGIEAEPVPRSLVAGSRHTLTIKCDGSLWAWGDNGSGQLGDDTTMVRRSPVKIMDNVTAIAAGLRHSMAVTDDGILWAWGSDFFGRLWEGSYIAQHSPKKIMEDVIYVSTGEYGTMAITSDGSLWVWGVVLSERRGNSINLSTISTPTRIKENVTVVSVGLCHSMAVTSDGKLWAWGNNLNGQIGDGTTIPRNGPEYLMNPVHVMDNVVSVAAGNQNSMAITSDGKLWAWGRCFRDRSTGIATSIHHTSPVFIMDDVVSISTNLRNSIAVTSDGGLWVLDRNNRGLLEESAHSDPLGPIMMMDNVVTATAGLEHTVAITSCGSLWAWGRNNVGQLGNGTITDSRTPIHIADDNYVSPMVETTGIGFSDISAGLHHSLAVKADGSLWSWGRNQNGQLGDGSTQIRLRPDKIMDNVVMA